VVAALVALEGRWVLAIVAAVVGAALLWLGGLWVTPWSSDAYVRRLSRSIEAWTTGAQWSYDVIARQRPRWIAQLAGLRPPAGFEADHERLLGLLAGASRLSDDRSISLPQRARLVAETATQIDDAMRHLAGRATTDEQRSYVDEVERTRRARRKEYVDLTAKAEQASNDALRRLRGLRVPDQARGGHEALIRAGEASGTAARRFHRAWQPPDPNEAASAARDMEAAWEAMRAANDRVLANLDYPQRWPVAPQRPR
jgi:hypothetical protein